MNNTLNKKIKRIKIILIIIAVILVILWFVFNILPKILCSIFTITVVDDSETHKHETSVILDLETNDINKLTIKYSFDNFLSTNQDNFIIKLEDENEEQLENIKFEIEGNFRTSYNIEFHGELPYKMAYKCHPYKFYGSHWDKKVKFTNEDGRIFLSVVDGDYRIIEYNVNSKENDNIYWIRIDGSSMYEIDESVADWNSANFNEDDIINVDKDAINDHIKEIKSIDDDFSLNYIELNNKFIGLSIDDLPATVSDGDVIKIYMIDDKVGLKGSYTVNFIGVDIYSYKNDDKGNYGYKLYDLSNMSYTLKDIDVISGLNRGDAIIDYNKIEETIYKNLKVQDSFCVLVSQLDFVSDDQLSFEDYTLNDVLYNFYIAGSNICEDGWISDNDYFINNFLPLKYTCTNYSNIYVYIFF